MAGEHDLRLGLFDCVERLEALVGGDVQRRGNDLGADTTRDRVARTKRVADEQDALGLEVERAVPGV